MNFDTQDQKTFILEALNEYHGRGCGTANYLKLTLGQSAQLLQHVQSVIKGEILKNPTVSKNTPVPVHVPIDKKKIKKRKKG